MSEARNLPIFGHRDLFGAFSSNPVLEVCGLQRMRERGEDMELMLRFELLHDEHVFQVASADIHGRALSWRVLGDLQIDLPDDGFGLPKLSDDARKAMKKALGFNEEKDPMPGA